MRSVFDSRLCLNFRTQNMDVALAQQIKGLCGPSPHSSKVH